MVLNDSNRSKPLKSAIFRKIFYNDSNRSKKILRKMADFNHFLIVFERFKSFKTIKIGDFS